MKIKKIKEYSYYIVIFIIVIVLSLSFLFGYLDKTVDKVADTSSSRPAKPPDKTMQLDIDNETSIDLVYIKPGTFIMGRNVGLVERAFARISSMFMVGKYPDDWPARKVKITKGFYIGKYKITSSQFCKFLNAVPNPEDYVELNEFARIEIKDKDYVPRLGCENCAINVVPWKGAVAFCEWLSHETGFIVRLPTEAEWEFTVRGSEGRPKPWGKGKVVWTDQSPVQERQNKEKYPHPWSCAPVDAFPENVTPDGVVGMISWTGEWCSDFYGVHYLKDDVIDPQGPTEERLLGDRSLNPYPYDKTYHVFRGRASFVGPREFGDEVLGGIYGFRVVIELP